MAPFNILGAKEYSHNNLEINSKANVTNFDPYSWKAQDTVLLAF